MLLVVAGVVIVTGTVFRWLGLVEHASVSFPWWLCVLATVLPMAGLSKCGWRHVVGRSGLSLVAFVELCPPIQAWIPGKEIVAMVGGVVMVTFGWLGTPEKAREAEFKELVPWLVGLALLVAGLRVAAFIAAR